jgi:transcription elongation factor Elf1
MAAFPSSPSNRCPVCGSEHFEMQTFGTDGRFVTQTCSVCGLSCRVVVGPESPTSEARISEWAALFPHD